MKTPSGIKLYRRSGITQFKRELEAVALGQPLPEPPSVVEPDPLMSHKAVAKEFDVSGRTIDRWVLEGKAAESEGEGAT